MKNGYLTAKFLLSCNCKELPPQKIRFTAGGFHFDVNELALVMVLSIVACTLISPIGIYIKRSGIITSKGSEVQKELKLKECNYISGAIEAVNIGCFLGMVGYMANTPFMKERPEGLLTKILGPLNEKGAPENKNMAIFD